MDKVVVQRISKSYDNELNIGIRYYSIISELNNLNLTERETQLLAFTAQRGTISSLSAKSEFCRIFGSSLATINNMISKLTKVGLLVKINRKTKVNPKITPDFSKGLVLQIIMFKKQDNESGVSKTS
jgi:hypothetical protein